MQVYKSCQFAAKQTINAKTPAKGPGFSVSTSITKEKLR